MDPTSIWFGFFLFYYLAEPAGSSTVTSTETTQLPTTTTATTTTLTTTTTTTDDPFTVTRFEDVNGTDETVTGITQGYQGDDETDCMISNVAVIATVCSLLIVLIVTMVILSIVCYRRGLQAGLNKQTNNQNTTNAAATAAATAFAAAAAADDNNYTETSHNSTASNASSGIMAVGMMYEMLANSKEEPRESYEDLQLQLKKLIMDRHKDLVIDMGAGDCSGGDTVAGAMESYTEEDEELGDDSNPVYVNFPIQS